MSVSISHWIWFCYSRVTVIKKKKLRQITSQQMNSLHNIRFHMTNSGLINLD